MKAAHKVGEQIAKQIEEEEMEEEKIVRRGRAVVERQFKNGQRFGEEKTKTIDLEVQFFDVTPASVSVKHGVTVNLGNYESARCDVMVTIPCYTEELDDALSFAQAKAEAFLQEQVKDIRK